MNRLQIQTLTSLQMQNFSKVHRIRDEEAQFLCRFAEECIIRQQLTPEEWIDLTDSIQASLVYAPLSNMSFHADAILLAVPITVTDCDQRWVEYDFGLVAFGKNNIFATALEAHRQERTKGTKT